MVGRKDKRRDKDPFDWFEDWPSWGFEDIFEEFDERFRKMQQHMNRVIREAMEGKLPSPKEGGPFI